MCMQMINLGTPHYMSPEMHAKAWYDEKSDIFACGIILYQMLTGIHPFFTVGKDTAKTSKEKIIECRVAYPSEQWNLVSAFFVKIW
jgi:serine/threonine protein kinase